MSDLADKLGAIEARLDAGRYRRGPWEQFVRMARQQPPSERLALAADISRVSRKLHTRNGLRTVSVATGTALELLATVGGGALLAVALANRWNVAALTAAAIWITTFEPLVKLFMGMLLGVRYEYAYLRGVEPRFKMRYGTYLAAPRWVRIVVHLSGTVGSPLAAALAGALTRLRLPLASRICMAASWVTLLLNAVFFVAVLIGLRRIGPLRLNTTSGGAAALELYPLKVRRP